MQARKISFCILHSAFCILLLARSVSLAGEVEKPIGPYLQEVSVNVFCPRQYGSGGRQGSGTVFLCKVDGKPSAWILTAHHVVMDLREVQSVIGSDGDDKKAVRYRDAQVLQEQVEGGRGVGEIKYDARIVNVDARRDIALLRVRKGDFTKEGATLYLEDQIPLVGTPIFHCGAPGGKEIGGTCTLTAGIVSRIGVRIPDHGGGSQHGIFDQTDVAALGGSSGGLLAIRDDGRWMGMITLGLNSDSDSFHWFVPVRSIRAWAKEVKVEWLFDDCKPRPTEADVEKIPLEVVAPGFAKSSQPKEPTPALREMIKGGGSGE